MDKRTFLKSSALLGVASVVKLTGLNDLMKSVAAVPSQELASNEDFWLQIRKGYTLNSEYINLENGYYCIQPNEILESYYKHIKDVNVLGAKYMRTLQIDNKKRIAARLAKLAGANEDEVVITRNTTESLDLIISGFKWQSGDEAVMAEQDYGAMLDMFKQVGERYGVVNKIVSLPINPKSDDEIVALYENAITSKTKLLMICHMVNITGQILPVKKIANMAHKKGVLVMVDGAHALAHIDFKISDLDCDFYGCSLHKWLSTPLGAGLLYVKKNQASKIWPLFAESPKEENDILRLNHTGTIPVHTDLAIENAIDYFEKIGAKRKEDRLRYLQNYWTSKVKHLPNIVYNTPDDSARSCAIANVGVKNIKPAELAKTLLDSYNIYTVAIDGKGVHGCRITPNIFTTTSELDVFVKALKELAS